MLAGLEVVPHSEDEVQAGHRVLLRVRHPLRENSQRGGHLAIISQEGLAVHEVLPVFDAPEPQHAVHLPADGPLLPLGHPLPSLA